MEIRSGFDEFEREVRTYGSPTSDTDAHGDHPPDIVAPAGAPHDAESEQMPELEDWEVGPEEDAEPRSTVRAPLGEHVTTVDTGPYDGDGWVYLPPADKPAEGSEEPSEPAAATDDGGQKPPTDRPPTDFAEPSPEGDEPSSNEPEETRLTPVTPEHTQRYLDRLYEDAGLESTASAEEVLAAARAKWEAAETVDDRARVMELLLGRRVDARELEALPPELVNGTSQDEDTFASFVGAITPLAEDHREEPNPPQDNPPEPMAPGENGGTPAAEGQLPSDQSPESAEAESSTEPVAQPQKLSDITIPFDEHYPEVPESDQEQVAQRFDALARDLMSRDAGEAFYVAELQNDLVSFSVPLGNNATAEVSVIALREGVEVGDGFPLSEQHVKTISVTEVDEQGNRSVQAQYRLFADGVVRRLDVDVAANNQLWNEFGEVPPVFPTASPREVIAITGGHGPVFETWLHETLPNRRLDRQMGNQDRPVSLQEFERLAAFLRR